MKAIVYTSKCGHTAEYAGILGKLTGLLAVVRFKRGKSDSRVFHKNLQNQNRASAIEQQ